MLTQRMMGRAFLLASGDQAALLDGLKSAAEFEEVLAALRGGGRAVGVELAPAPGRIIPCLDQLEARWRAFKPGYEWLLDNADKRASGEFKLRLAGLEAQSELLLDAAEEVTRRLRRHASARIINVAIGLLLGLAAAALLAFVLAFRTLRRELIKPLEELISSAERISTGDYHAVPAEIRDGELGTLALALEKISDSAVRRINADKITNTLLNLAVETEDLDAFYREALTALLSSPWLCVEPKGAIFTADPVSRTLTLAAQSGLNEALLTACAEVPSGRCLCGRAAGSREVVHAENLDARHETTYPGIAPHGHYCVPMLSGDRLVGVLNFYLDPGHRYDQEEADRLRAIAALMAQITEKKLAQAENRRSSEALRQTTDAAFITDTDGKITYVNEAFEKMTGYAAAEALGRTPNLLKSGEHPQEYYAGMWTSLQKGIPWTGRIVNRRKDGTAFTVQANIFPLKDSAGKATAYVTLQTDISAQEELEEQLRQSQKMEAMGRLAGGVAHDFNNILMAIDSYAGFIRKQLPVDSQEAADAGEISRAVQKAAALTRQLLAFSRKQKAVFQPLDLRQAVLGSEKMLRRLLGEAVSLKISAAEDVKPIKGDPGQIDQVIMNLLVNAKDAMPGGGGIEIRVAGHKSILPVPTPLGTMPAGEYSVLSVADTGEGMNKETLSRIFDPFFTTKPKGKGTGLGLSIVYGAVKHHGAYILVSSRPGKGSIFTIYFPVLAEPVSGEGQAADVPAVSALLNVSVFLAEDDAVLVASVARMLRDLGAEVRAFSEPEKLLEAAVAHPGRIDLLLTDIVMPGMDGFALAERLAAQRPGLKVIYMSGYTDPDIFKGRLERPGLVFLQKPFNEALLAETLSRVLAAGAA
ncbi:MAG: hypothetical protein A2X35_07150 [Elusimicrobia bacterium GWA2_61_42]|nr:MAG: hypothetical protein A2X35_07150 [Elusimicrobia bacterium GWA2_61_42]OGR74989.1 MAG: hypothetical protein A2X38_01300 [Elusimicrobia bacterium GWC2_61_25]